MKVVNNGITKETGALLVDEVKASQFKDGVFQAQLRQKVTTTYPSKRAGNSLSDALYSTEDFGFPDGQTFESTRICWVDVPANTTKAQVEALLAAKPNACIQRVISTNVMDVLTDEQKSAIARNIRTVGEYQESLRVKKQDGTDIEGAPQYRQHFFKGVAVEDVDLRQLVAAPAKKANAEANMLAN